MNSKSWKTTVGGVLLSVGGVMATMSNPWWMWKVGTALQAIGGLMLGVTARDNNVPSSAVPKAAERDAEIKADTTIITKP